MGKKKRNTEIEQSVQTVQASPNGWAVISAPVKVIGAILTSAVPAAFVIGQSYAKYEANKVLTENQEKLVTLQNSYEKEIHDLRNQVYELQNEIVTLKQDKEYGEKK